MTDLEKQLLDALETIDRLIPAGMVDWVEMSDALCWSKHTAGEAIAAAKAQEQ